MVGEQIGYNACFFTLARGTLAREHHTALIFIIYQTYTAHIQSGYRIDPSATCVTLQFRKPRPIEIEGCGTDNGYLEKKEAKKEYFRLKFREAASTSRGSSSRYMDIQ